ncbi:MAG TPA: metallophosphoesterase [Phycisphaerae bacterium]|nr:metallophosphoesterase [Phycisphaerae bacterium]
MIPSIPGTPSRRRPVERGTARRQAPALGLMLFVSLWSAWAVAEEPLRFAVTADNKTHVGYATIVRRMAEVPGGRIQFLISAGDQNPAAMTRSQLDAVFGKTLPWYPVVGNHDASTTATDEMTVLREHYDTHLKGKVNAGPEGTHETTYSFDAGDVHVAIINQYWDGKPKPGHDAVGNGDVVPALVAWLRKDLAASRKPWKIVVGHEPAFPQHDQDLERGRHATSSLNADTKHRDAFWKVLEDTGCAAYVCGHTHCYSRYQPEGSRVWQIDVAQARGSSTSWKYDAFVIVTADRSRLTFDVHRNLKKEGQFEVTDSLTLQADAARAE